MRYIYILFLLSVTQAGADEVNFGFEFINFKPSDGLILVENNNLSHDDIVIDQKGKKFINNFFVLNNDGDLLIRNSDKYGHNVYINDRVNDIKYNSGLIKKGDSKKVKIDINRNSIVRVGCKIHPRMKSYIVKSKSNKFKEVKFFKNNNENKFKIVDVTEEESNFNIFIPNVNPIFFEINKGESKEFKLEKDNKFLGFVLVSRM